MIRSKAAHIGGYARVQLAARMALHVGMFTADTSTGWLDAHNYAESRCILDALFHRSWREAAKACDGPEGLVGSGVQAF